MGKSQVLFEAADRHNLNIDDVTFLNDWFIYVFARDCEMDSGYFMEWCQRYSKGFLYWWSYMSSDTRRLTAHFIGRLVQ